MYETGSGFIDRGNGHVHLVRNEGDIDLILITVQLFPADAAFIQQKADEEILARIMAGANVRSDMEAGIALGKAETKCIM